MRAHVVAPISITLYTCHDHDYLSEIDYTDEKTLCPNFVPPCCLEQTSNHKYLQQRGSHDVVHLVAGQPFNNTCQPFVNTLYRHTHMHIACTHRRTHARTSTCRHTHALTHARTHAQAHADTRTHARTHARTHKHMQTHALTHARTHARTHRRTHKHTHAHTHSGTRKHLHLMHYTNTEMNSTLIHKVNIFHTVFMYIYHGILMHEHLMTASKASPKQAI